MQGRIISLIIFTLSMGFKAEAQTETIQLCAGESLELKSEAYYDGTYFWEFSRDQENWITISHNNSPQFNYFPEETGFYRLRIQDEACGQDYFSAIKRVEVISADEKLVLKSDLLSESIKEGEEIRFNLESTEGLDMISYHFNTGQSIVSPDGKLTKRMGLEETEVYVTARSQGQCFVSNKITWPVNPNQHEHEHERCGSYHISYSQWLKYHPNKEEATIVQYNKYLRKKEERFEEWMDEQMVKNTAKNIEENEEEVYTIPVIFHLISYDQNEPFGVNLDYITPEIIQDQFGQLNADFRHYPEAPGYLDRNFAVDTKIQFCLASETPDGDPLDEIGITRTSASEFGIPNPPLEISDVDTHVKSSIQWNANDYLNIWVIGGRVQICGEDCPDDVPPSPLSGYAYFPDAPINEMGEDILEGININGVAQEIDGVVISHKTIGSILNPNENQIICNDPETSEELICDARGWGRTLTHEIGHYLGLNHPWESIDGSSCGIDDFCNDTPNTEHSFDLNDSFDNDLISYTCNEQISCGQIIQWENFMDYASDECRSVFTQCQKERMRIVLENSPNRTGLISGSVFCIEEICEQVLSLQLSLGLNPEVGYSFTWDHFSPPENHYVRIAPAAAESNFNLISDPIISGETTNYFLTADQINPNEEYVFEIRAICGDFSQGEAVQLFFNSSDLNSPCESPYPQVQNLTASYVDQDNTINLSWSPILGSSGVRVDYRPVGEISWQTIEEVEMNLSNLVLSAALFESSTAYECRVRAFCSTNPLIIGPWSDLANFTTGTTPGPVPCSNPYPSVQNQSAFALITGDGIRLSWNVIPGSIGCQIQYGLIDSDSETDTIVSGNDLNEFVIDQTELIPDQEYRWKIRCGCSYPQPLIAGPWTGYHYFISGEIGTLAPPPKANFFADDTKVAIGQEISFTDQSENNPNTWSWDFGDGNFSTDQNPIHSYNTPGFYTVNLTVENEDGTDNQSIWEYIYVYPDQEEPNFRPINGTIPSYTVLSHSSSPYLITSDLIVDEDVKVKIESGVVLKFKRNWSISDKVNFIVSGSLDLESDSLNPIVFTSERDDEYAGDSNEDGDNTNPTKGDWGFIGLEGKNGNGFDFHDCIVRYGGGNSRMIETYRFFNNQDDINIIDCDIAGSLGDAIRITGLANPLISGNTIYQCSAAAIKINSQGQPIISNNDISFCPDGIFSDASTDDPLRPLIENNTISDCDYPFTQYNYALPVYSNNTLNNCKFNAYAIGGSMNPNSISEESWNYTPLRPYLVRSNFTVGDKMILTIPAQTVIKFERASNTSSKRVFTVRGKLDLESNPTNPVVFTSEHDDDYGGDTRGNGNATNPTKGDWGYIRLEGKNGNGFDFHDCIVRYGGSHSSGNRMIEIDRDFNNHDDINIIDCDIAGSLGDAIRITGLANPLISGSNIYAIGWNWLGINNTTDNTIQAEDNYWGDSSGPNHPDNPGGQGVKVSVNVDFTPWSSNSLFP